MHNRMLLLLLSRFRHLVCQLCRMRCVVCVPMVVRCLLHKINVIMTRPVLRRVHAPSAVFIAAMTTAVKMRMMAVCIMIVVCCAMCRRRSIVDVIGIMLLRLGMRGGSRSGACRHAGTVIAAIIAIMAMVVATRASSIDCVGCKCTAVAGPARRATSTPARPTVLQRRYHLLHLLAAIVLAVSVVVVVVLTMMVTVIVQPATVVAIATIGEVSGVRIQCWRWRATVKIAH